MIFSKIRFMYKIFIGIFFLFAGVYVNAQTISGHITDITTHQPVAGASVYFPQLKLGTITNTDGYYQIPSLPKGTYEMEIQMLGYATLNKQVTVKKKPDS